MTDGAQTSGSKRTVRTDAAIAGEPASQSAGDVVVHSGSSPNDKSSPRLTRQPGAMRRSFRLQEAGVVGVLIVLVAVVAIPHPSFVGSQSLTNLAQQSAFFGTIALGMVFLLAMREIDLSVGGNYAVCTIAAAYLVRSGWNPWMAAGVAVLLGGFLGAINGILSNLFKIPIIIISLGTLTAYQGIARVISNSSPISGQPIETSFYQDLGATYLGIPAVVWLMVIACVILTLIFTRSRYGFAVRAVGSNERAARLTGYHIGRIRLISTILIGLLCGLSAVFTLAYFGSADPGVGSGYELSVIAAAIIGGTGLAGGSGSVPGALIGALIISTIGGGLTQFGVPSNWGNIATGIVILATVGADAVLRRRSANRGRP